MTTDLTKGSPLKQIFLFSIPYLIGNLFQQFYNVADMVIIGRTLDINAYTAIGATSSIIWFASGAVQSLGAGFSAIVARHFGARDNEKIKQSFAAGIRLTALISAILTLLCVIFARDMLNLMRTPESIMERSYRYIICIFAGLVICAFFNLLSNVIRALGDSRTPLVFLVIACLVNVVLDYVFIKYCGMDTEGAGLATVIAQLLSVILCIIYIVKKQPLLHISKIHFKNDRQMNASLLKIGLPMAFLNMVLSIGSIVTQFVTNGLSDVYISAYTTAAKIESFVTQPLLSFGSALSVFSSQNYGAGKYSRVLNGTRKTLLMGFIWSAAATLIMILFGKFIVTLIAGDVSADITSNAYIYNVINSVCTLIVAPLIVYKSVLQAVGRTTFSMISGFTEILGRAGVSLAVMALISVEQTAFIGLCFTTPTAWLFGLLTVIPDYFGMVKKFKKLPDTASEANEQILAK